MKEKRDQSEFGKVTRRAFIGGTAAVGGVLGVGAMTATASPSSALATATGVTNHAAGFDLPVKRVDKPTYTEDIVGKIQRVDQRDELFSRSSLVKGTPEYEEYYKNKPELEKHHPGIAKFWDPEWAFKNHQDDWANTLMGNATFMGGVWLSSDDVVDGPVSPDRIELSPEVATEKIKGFCKNLGAELVTIGPCREEWIYSHRGFGERRGEPITDTWKYAISIAIPQDYDMMATGTDVCIGIESGQIYARMALIVSTVAQYIRMLGYRARGNHVENYVAMCVPLAIDSGMGEMGRNGYLVTKEYGTNFRLANVLTDLPMVMDKPVDLGVQDFCSQCKLCAEWCPSGSISMGEKVDVRGVKKWEIDRESCLTYWNEHCGINCGLCQVNCPWSKPPSWIHSMAVESATHTSIARRLLPKMEKVVYGKWVNHEAPDWVVNSRKGRI